MNSNTIKRVPTYIGGLFAVITGLFFMVYPEIAAGFIGILFGIMLFVAGISEVIGYIISIKQFREENYGKAAGAEVVLVYSLVIIVIGIVFLLKPSVVLQLLATILGIFFIIDGIVKLRREIFLFQMKNIYCWITAVLSLLLIIAGIALLVNPFEGTKSIIMFSGAAFIVSGIESCSVGIIRLSEMKTRKG